MRWLLAGLLLAPVLELVVAIQVGQWLGALTVIGALLLITVVGVLLIRRKGSLAWQSLNRSLQAGEPPSKELADAVVLLLGGVLLAIPGFVSDLAALLLLFPLTRPIARRPVEQMFRRAAADRVTLLGAFPPGGGPGAFGPGGGPGPFGPGGGPGSFPPGGGRRPRFGGDVVEGEIVEDDPPAR